MSENKFEWQDIIVQKMKNPSNGENILEIEKEALIHIFSVNQLWKGHYSDVYNVETDMWDRKWVFAIKEYRDEFEHEVDNAIKIYISLKNNDLPVRKTFRKIKDKNAILMTLWSYKNYALFTPHPFNYSNDEKFFKENPIMKVSNLQNFISSSYQQIQKLSKLGYSVPYDAYFFIYNKDNHHMELLVGDYDQFLHLNSDTFEYNFNQFIALLRFWEPYFDLGFTLQQKLYEFIHKKQRSFR